MEACCSGPIVPGWRSSVQPDMRARDVSRLVVGAILTARLRRDAYLARAHQFGWRPAKFLEEDVGLLLVRYGVECLYFPEDVRNGLRGPGPQYLHILRGDFRGSPPAGCARAGERWTDLWMMSLDSCPMGQGHRWRGGHAWRHSYRGQRLTKSKLAYQHAGSTMHAYQSITSKAYDEGDMASGNASSPCAPYPPGRAIMVRYNLETRCVDLHAQSRGIAICCCNVGRLGWCRE